MLFFHFKKNASLEEEIKNELLSTKEKPNEKNIHLGMNIIAKAHAESAWWWQAVRNQWPRVAVHNLSMIIQYHWRSWERSTKATRTSKMLPVGCRAEACLNYKESWERQNEITNMPQWLEGERKTSHFTKEKQKQIHDLALHLGIFLRLVRNLFRFERQTLSKIKIRKTTFTFDIYHVLILMIK